MSYLFFSPRPHVRHMSQRFRRATWCKVLMQDMLSAGETCQSVRKAVILGKINKSTLHSYGQAQADMVPCLLCFDISLHFPTLFETRRARFAIFIWPALFQCSVRCEWSGVYPERRGAPRMVCSSVERIVTDERGFHPDLLKEARRLRVNRAKCQPRARLGVSRGCPDPPKNVCETGNFFHVTWTQGSAGMPSWGETKKAFCCSAPYLYSED